MMFHHASWYEMECYYFEGWGEETADHDRQVFIDVAGIFIAPIRLEKI